MTSTRRSSSNVPAAEPPADAKPNGYDNRMLYGVRLVRHNVRTRLREYISPTVGRVVAKPPPGWKGKFTPDLHVVGNEVFTTLTTTEHKRRVSVYGVLAGAPVGHCVGEHALGHPELGVAAREVLRRVHAEEPVLEWADESLTELATKLCTESLNAAEMDSFLRSAMPGRALRRSVTCARPRRPNAKARVRKRDISFGPRSEQGLQAWDALQSVVGTLRKLGVSPNVFIADRITQANTISPLDVLVTNECLRRWGPRDAMPGTS